MVRDYKKEYAEFGALPEQKKRRAARNRARQEAADKGLVHKGDGKEVDHINAPRKGPLDNVKTRVVPKRVNRQRQPKRS